MRSLCEGIGDSGATLRLSRVEKRREVLLKLNKRRRLAFKDPENVNKNLLVSVQHRMPRYLVT
jgi:hypothetical protein